MPRFNITMSQELWDAVGDAAPEGNRSFFIRRALEAALGAGVEPGMASGSSQVSSPASPRASDPAVEFAQEVNPYAPGNPLAAPLSRRCEKCGKEFGSPSLRRCTVCNGKVVPEPS